MSLLLIHRTTLESCEIVLIFLCHFRLSPSASLDYRWEGIKGTNSDCDRDPSCPDVRGFPSVIGFVAQLLNLLICPEQWAIGARCPSHRCFSHTDGFKNQMLHASKMPDESGNYKHLMRVTYRFEISIRCVFPAGAIKRNHTLCVVTSWPVLKWNCRKSPICRLN